MSGVITSEDCRLPRGTPVIVLYVLKNGDEYYVKTEYSDYSCWVKKNHIKVD